MNNKTKTTKAWVKAHKTELMLVAAGTVGFVLARNRYKAEATRITELGTFWANMFDHGGEIYAKCDGQEYVLNDVK